MADKQPFWSLCVTDFFASRTCASMDGLQQACYLLALARCWEWDGLPADPDEFRIALRLPKDWFEEHGQSILEAFKTHGGKLRHPRQEKQRQELRRRTEDQSNRGKKGAEVRWRKHSVSNAKAMLKNGLPSPSPSPSEDPLPPRGRGGNPTSHSEESEEFEDVAADLTARFGSSRESGTNPRALGENPRAAGDTTSAKRYHAVKFLQDHVGLRLASGTDLLHLGIDNGRSDQKYSDMQLKELEALVKNTKAVLADQAIADDKEPLTVLRDVTDGQTDDSTGSD